MKRILITGAAGSIGSALTYDLLKNDNGAIVCALDSSEDGLFRLRQNARSLGIDGNLRDFLGDIRDLERIKFAMDSCTDVYHCAALKHVHLSEYNQFGLTFHTFLKSTVPLRHMLHILAIDSTPE